MAVDWPPGDDLEEVGGSRRETSHDHGPQHSDNTAAKTEMAETRTRAEYHQALQEHAGETASPSPDIPARSAWDDADALTRPPLDALRVPPERAVHILDRDATGGGHRYGTGAPGKTEFPAHWDDDKIIDSILGVARSPDSADLQRNGRWKVQGVRDEVKLAVVIMQDGRVWSAYPLPGSPGVRQNPRNR